jgi:hypothetical protein
MVKQAYQEAEDDGVCDLKAKCSINVGDDERACMARHDLRREPVHRDGGVHHTSPH